MIQKCAQIHRRGWGWVECPRHGQSGGHAVSWRASSAVCDGSVCSWAATRRTEHFLFLWHLLRHEVASIRGCYEKAGVWHISFLEAAGPVQHRSFFLAPLCN